MKKYLFFALLLLLCFPLKKAAAQPTQIWSSYYGWYAQYSPHNGPKYGKGTVIQDVKFNKRDGYIYILGITTDTSGIASSGSFKENLNIIDLIVRGDGGSFLGKNVFLAKFDTLGHRIWATYYGGNRDVYSPAMAIDKNNNIYISAMTSSDSGIATSGSYQPNYTGNIDYQRPGFSTYSPFIVKFNDNGQRIWGTYYPLSNTNISDLVYDSITNHLYIAGYTSDTSGVATSGSFKDHYVDNDSTDAFIIKLDTAGQPVWGTYYGGNKNDAIGSLWVGSAGNLYALGWTTASLHGIATPGSELDSSSSIYGSPFLVKFDSSGQRLWGTYLGRNVDSSWLYLYAMTGAINGEGFDEIYMVGRERDTLGLEITPNAYQTTYGGGPTDMVFFKYTGNGFRDWSTYFGGNGEDAFVGVESLISKNSLSVDDDGNIYLIGNTSSTQGIEHSCHPLATNHKKSVIAKWNPSGNLLWSSYSDATIAFVSAAEGNNFYVGGATNYDGMATAGVHQPTKVPNKKSGFFARLSSECPPINLAILQNQGNLRVVDTFNSYQWFKNNNLISGANSYQYQITSGDSGNYYVVVSDSCGCNFNSDTVSFHGTGISFINQGEMQVVILPNPAKRSVFFKFDLNKPQNVSILIYDLVGRLLLEKNYGILLGTQRKELNISSFNTGLYLIKFNVGNRSYVKKLEVY